VLTINWDLLNIQPYNLQHLDEPLTEEEVHQAILEAPTEKAPGLDGYIGLFYKHCWNTMKTDLMKALEDIFNLRGRHWNLLNTANNTLVPKKEDTQSAKDYRSISLIHSVAKILAKVMANRLAPNLETIVSKSPSAFVKGRSIQDNFQYIEGAI
jgi:hypothetical protein